MNAVVKTQGVKASKNNAFIPNLNKPINPLTYLTDSYKVSHVVFEIKGVKEIYSNFTARFGKYMQEMVGAAWDNQYVVFGVQYAMLEMNHLFNTGFFDRHKAEVMQEMKDMFSPYIGWTEYKHFEALHDLGYLPIKIKALPEGTLAPIGCPFLTARNTVDGFEWLPNYVESLLSTLIWKPLTIATMARFFRLKTNEFALKTNGSLLGTEFQNHDFHVRGASGWQSAAINGCAFLLSSCGTDNMPSLDYAERYYGSTNKQGLLAGSVSAGEHSVTTLGILTMMEALEIGLVDGEEAYVDYVLDRIPTGIFSYVSDSFDYWALVDQVLPNVKERIMKRDGKFVVRGDSGNPVHIIAGYRIKEVDSTSKEFTGCGAAVTSELLHRKAKEAYAKGYEVINFKGTLDNEVFYKIFKDSTGDFGLKGITRSEAVGTIQRLYEIFGGTVNEQGFKVLDSHIGMIYGDGINLQRQHEILQRLEDKGFMSLNIVFGVGSYSLNMVGRDHLGMAIKATNAIVEINGQLVDKPIYKDPKTDSSKKSARGLLQVTVEGNKVVAWKDCVTREEEGQGALRVVLEDSQHLNLETLFTVRDRLWVTPK